MTSPIEVELKFLVPPAARKQLAAEVARGSTTLARTSLNAMYLDTADRRLARHGMAWRLRREGRRWIQTLKSGGANALERFEHEVVRPDASQDASAHAGTPLGDQLIALLRKAHADGVEPEVRFRALVRRIARKVRTRGAVVEIAFDEGRLMAAAAMLALADRWRKRFGLIYEPHSKAERGDRLAEGRAYAPVRRAKHPTYSSKVTATEAFGAVLDECLAQITRNAVGLTHGDPAQRVEHVHQVRVGIRRLRSALRSFRGWVPAPPGDLIDGLLTRSGLQRKTTFADRALLIGAGALAGGILALLFAPTSGKELRQKLAGGIGDGTAALKEKASDLTDGASQLIGRIQESAEGAMESGKKMADEAISTASSNRSAPNGHRRTDSIR